MSNSYGQEDIIKGVVTDSEGNVLSQVQIKIKGNTQVYRSNKYGIFEFELKTPETIVFEKQGMITEELLAYGGTKIKVILKRADNTPIDLLNLNELLNLRVVSASKVEETMNSAASNIIIINKQTIQEWGCRDLKDVMRRVAGFQVIPDRDEWVFGSRGNVSDNNMKYLILIDGHRTNSIENFCPGHIIELPNNLSNIHHIEIVKGPGSSIWGADAMSGIINIITKDGSNVKGNGEASVTYGQENYFVSNLQIAKKFNSFSSFYFSVTASQSDGREVWQSRNNNFSNFDSSSINMSPAGTYKYKTLLDNHLPGHFFQAKAIIGNFILNTYYHEGAFFNRVYESNQGRKNYLQTNKTFIDINYTDTTWDNLIYCFKLGIDNNLAEYLPITLGQSNSLLTNITWRDRGITASASASKSFFDERINVSAGTDYRFTKAGPNQRMDNFNPDSIKNITQGIWFDNYLLDHQIGGFLNSKISFQKLTLNLGTRSDYNKQRGNEALVFNPRIALIYSPIQIFDIKLIYNTGYLRPANFHTTGGNSINSEKMKQIDLIFLATWKNLIFSTNFFYQELKGFINILKILPEYRFANVANYYSRGVEFDVSGSLNSQLKIWSNYTYLFQNKATNINPSLAYNDRRTDINNNLLTFPKYFFNTGLTVYVPNTRLIISPALRITGTSIYRNTEITSPSDNTSDKYTHTPIQPYIDVNIIYKFNKYLSMSVYADNLLNNTSFIPLSVWNGVVENYGRHISGKFTINF